MTVRHIGIFLLASAMFCGIVVLGGSGKIISRTETITNTTDTLVNDSSIVSDTFGVTRMTTEGYCYKTALGRISVAVSGNAARGYGLSDSCAIRLYTSFAGRTHAIARNSCGALPCSLIVTKNSAIAGIDTLWKEDLFFVVQIWDTAGDTVMTSDHDVDYHFILKE